MYGVECPNRFARKRLTRALDDFRTDAEDMPMRRRRRQVCAPVSRLGLCQLTQRGGAKQNAIALDEREVRCDDRFGGSQQLTNVAERQRTRD